VEASLLDESPFVEAELDVIARAVWNLKETSLLSISLDLDAETEAYLSLSNREAGI
jgi:hypothetical protein